MGKSIANVSDIRYLVDEETQSDNVVRDLLDLPMKKVGKIFHHPVLVTFIQKRQEKRRRKRRRRRRRRRRMRRRR